MDKDYDYYIEKIQDRTLKALAKAATDKYGDCYLEQDAMNIADWLTFLLTNDKLIAENSHALFIDVLMTSALTHNLTYKYGGELADLFKTRTLLYKLNEEEQLGVPDTYLESVCQAIEGQLGKDHPMVLLMPNPNTPGAHFALACSIYYKTENTVF